MLIVNDFDITTDSADCLVRRKGELTAHNAITFSPDDSLDDFEEVTNEEIAAEEANKIEEEKRAAAIRVRVRSRYSVDDELAILRQRDSKPEEFAEYNAFVEAIKAELSLAE